MYKVLVKVSTATLWVMVAVMVYAIGCTAPEKTARCARGTSYTVRLTMIETGADVQRVMDVVSRHKNLAKIFRDDFVRTVYEPVLSLEIVFESIGPEEAEGLRQQLAACHGVTQVVAVNGQ